jgi:hypothetical protein
MKVQILLDGEVIDTQIISTEPMANNPPLNDVKRLALKAALADKKIRISEALRATFKLFDVSGGPVGDDRRD